MYGADSVDSYAAEFEPLEWTLSHKYQDIGALCYIKIIVNREDSDRILGMHIAAPNAGEIIQGFALAFRKGITYKVSHTLFHYYSNCNIKSHLLPSDRILTTTSCQFTTLGPVGYRRCAPNNSRAVHYARGL